MDAFFVCCSKEFTDCVFPGDFLTVLKIKFGYLNQKLIPKIGGGTDSDVSSTLRAGFL